MFWLPGLPAQSPVVGGGGAKAKCKEEAQPLALPASAPGVARGVYVRELAV